MKVEKRVLDPHRVRKVPVQFSWIDQRIIGQRCLGRLSHRATALYLFLVIVGDDKGLSFYSDRTIGDHLNSSPDELARCRAELIGARLIAYHRQLYQVLSLDVG